jgi:signal-transduction protein with cAMP-binding, CBS, and nucleotidyltransferase domain
MNTSLEVLTEHDTVQTAAAVMADAHVGLLPICDAKKRVIGVVTDRDLAIRGIAKKVAPATTSAALLMSAPPITCLDSADVKDAEALMVREGKSRLVIVDGEGKLAGLLTLADLIEHAPARRALATARAILWREAIGARGGAPADVPLLKDDPAALATAPVGDPEPADRDSVVKGGHWRLEDAREFPG